MSLQARLQATAASYQKLQNDLQVAVEARSRLDAQRTENESVKKEFSNLKAENDVFKLIGPVLIKQDTAEAKSNVEKRLEFINSEIKRVEGQIKDMESQSDKKRAEIADLQAALQSQMNQEQVQGTDRIGLVS